MTEKPEDKFFSARTKEETWQRYCGFLDFSIEEFMNIQKHLLMEQIDLVYDSFLGRKIIGDYKPRSVEEFRRAVPLTNYEDYALYLNEQNEQVLAVKPSQWVHTSGRGGSFKWTPLTASSLELWYRTPLTLMILASATKRGEVNFELPVRLLHNFPARPYGSGLTMFGLAQRFSIRTMPPVEESERMQVPERIAKGFEMALREGIDFITSMSSVLIKMGDAFAERSQRRGFSLSMLYPKLAYRMLRALFRARLERRAVLPKDIWPEVKGIISWGIDTEIYRDKILHHWGKTPYELYVFTEAGITAVHGWNKKAMTFLPNVAFLEFVPEREWLKTREDKSYQPTTILFNEVEAGEQYEIVITNFYGMPFLRYRVGDLIKVVSIGDEEMGTSLPQISFAGRADDIIDIYGIAKLDERTIWRAIANCGFTYDAWSARKENYQGKPVLHLYIEPKQELKAEEIEDLIHHELIKLDCHYKEAIEEIEANPIKVTILPKGSFEHYFEERRKAGADLSHLRPPHMNASDEIIKLLCSRRGNDL